MKITSMFTHFLSHFEKQNWTDLHYLYVSNHFGENERQLEPNDESIDNEHC